jgi:small subunit ribosomal protein S8
MMTDPIADMLTRIRNALHAKYEQVVIPASRLKVEIANVLKDEGFIHEVESIGEGKRKSIVIKLKYTSTKKPVISDISRVSKLGRRVYLSKDEIKSIRYGRGVAILSTSKGIMKDADAKKNGIGGEILCTVW